MGLVAAAPRHVTWDIKECICLFRKCQMHSSISKSMVYILFQNNVDVIMVMLVHRLRRWPKMTSTLLVNVSFSLVKMVDEELKILNHVHLMIFTKAATGIRF